MFCAFYHQQARQTHSPFWPDFPQCIWATVASVMHVMLSLYFILDSLTFSLFLFISVSNDFIDLKYLRKNSIIFDSTKYKYIIRILFGRYNTVRYYLLVEALLIPILLFAPTGITGSSQSELSQHDSGTKVRQCVEYDTAQKLITVRCKSVHLTNIYNNLSNIGILTYENGDHHKNSDNKAKVWILNSGIIIDKDSSLIIDSSDTSWLKITATPTMQLKQKTTNITDEDTDYSDDPVPMNSSGIKASLQNTNNSNKERIENVAVVVSKHNGDSPNGIHVHGSLIIDNVKITSWDPEKKDVIDFGFGKRPGEEHTKSDYDTAEPRAFIRISRDATGTTNITNSEIGYLGYSCSRCAGLSYYGGDGSVIKNSDIHHLLKGYYSKNMGHMLIEGNKFHDNFLYGIDPHTGTHDLVIRNNKVYDNNASGIICSKDCYNLLIEGNEVYRSGGVGRGIAFSINTTNSTARNNDVHHNERCISFNRESNNNQVYNNTISNCNIGIYLSNTSKNSIDDNSITHSDYGIMIKQVTSNNITNNIIDKTKKGISFISKNTSNINIDNLNSESPNWNEINQYLDLLTSSNKLFDVSNPYAIEAGKIKGVKELVDFSSIHENFTYSQPKKFKATLNGDNEISPVKTIATANAKFTWHGFKVKDDVITSRINVTGINNLTGAHIYKGNRIEIGQPIVDLLKSGKQNKTKDTLIINTDIKASDFEGSMKGKTLEDLRTAMASNGTYVNIQTSSHPNGEIRGQIKASGNLINATRPEPFSTAKTTGNEAE
jgi:mannuronan 5-epimerase